MPFSKDKWAEGFHPGGEVSVDEDDENKKLATKGKKKEFKKKLRKNQRHQNSN